MALGTKIKAQLVPQTRLISYLFQSTLITVISMFQPPGEKTAEFNSESPSQLTLHRNALFHTSIKRWPKIIHFLLLRVSLRTNCPNIAHTCSHFVEEDMDIDHNPQAEKAKGNLSMLSLEIKTVKETVVSCTRPKISQMCLFKEHLWSGQIPCCILWVQSI